jgi:hypothetical protein
LTSPPRASTPKPAPDCLAEVREHDPSATLVIALHDRQAPDPPWEPTSRIELAPVEPAYRSGSG